METWRTQSDLCLFWDLQTSPGAWDVKTESTGRSACGGSASSWALQMWEVQGSVGDVVSMTAKDLALAAEGPGCESSLFPSIVLEPWDFI